MAMSGMSELRPMASDSGTVREPKQSSLNCFRIGVRLLA